MPRRFRAIFTELYKQYNPSMSPMLALNATVEDNNYDINVSPDKREIFLKNEEEAANQLQKELNEFFENIQRTKAYDCQSVISASVQSVLNPSQSWVSKKRPYSEITPSIEDSIEDDSLIEGKASKGKNEEFKSMKSKMQAEDFSSLVVDDLD